MMGTYENVGNAVRGILSAFDWNVVTMLYHDYAEVKSKGHSDCHHTLSAVFNVLRSRESTHQSFDQEDTSPGELKDLLNGIKDTARSKSN